MIEIFILLVRVRKFRKVSAQSVRLSNMNYSCKNNNLRLIFKKISTKLLIIILKKFVLMVSQQTKKSLFCPNQQKNKM